MEKTNLKCLVAFAGMSVLGALSAWADITVNGVITDSQGEPLVGATVLEKGTSKGTSSDLDGNFKLTVADNAMLVFSYVGCDSQTLKAQPQMTVVLMENSTLLD